MANPFFDHPILNSPYECPIRHWELDESGQPTQKVLERRRRAEFITPIPKPKKRKQAQQQAEIVFDEGKGLSTKEQQYDPTSIINEVRQNVNMWRGLAQPCPMAGQPGNGAPAPALAGPPVRQRPPILLSGGSRRNRDLADRGSAAHHGRQTNSSTTWPEPTKTPIPN